LPTLLSGDTTTEVSRPVRSDRLMGLPAPLVVVLIGAGATGVLLPFDGALAGALDHVHLAGDVRREWSALQQFGQGVSILLIGTVIALLDRAGRRRLWDLALSLAVTGVVVTLMKWLVGRPRPKFGDPTTFLWPWGTYEFKPDSGPVVRAHAWDLTVDTHAQLWSMPSSHTAFASAVAVFLALMYPRLRWLALLLAGAVAVGRLVFDAHWPTDVVVGATVGTSVAWWAVGGGVGVRLVGRIWGNRVGSA